MRIIVGICAGFFWAMDTVVLNLFLEKGDWKETAALAAFIPFLATFLHDLCSSVYLLFFMGGKKQLRKVVDALRTREGKFVILGALLGGPVGMSGYVFSIQYLGAANTAMVSSLFPALGSVMAWIFLKEKLVPGQVLGLLLSVAGMCFMGGGMITGNLGHALPGVCCAMVCVGGWAGEVVICSYGMKSGIVNNEQALTIRQTTSSLFYFCVILTLIGGHGAAWNILKSPGMLIIMAAALAGTVSYLCYYRTIHRLGASTAMALNVTYAAWALIFEALLLHEQKSMRQCICGAIIISGALLSALSKKQDVEL